MMMRSGFYKIVLTSVFFIIASNNAKAQRLDSLLNILDENYPQEKIHLHLDKSFYNPGETIWFKAYLTADNLPAPLSKTCYAELTDEKGNILQRKMMPVLEAGAASGFDLPDTLSSSKLFIRAYTSWMLNFDSSLLTLLPVHIIPAKPAAKRADVPTVYTLTFFPEGGDLVQDINGVVAFKANDQEGTPFAVSGNIVDDKSKQITTFKSVHDGMGYFSLQPGANEKYKALWKDKKGVQHETPLPAAKSNGLILGVTNVASQLQYTLTRSENIPEASAFYYVVAQMRQRLVYSAKINLSKKITVTAPIITDSLPNGVLQLTVFNEMQVPVAERVVFINNNSYYFITDLHAIEKNITKRGRNVLQIDVGNNLLTNLSVAVTDAGINPVTKNETNIYTQLLLSTDLKGYIFNPAYYFSGDEDSVKQHLDLVMMTNGWRRFKWENLVAEKWPVLTFAPEDFISIKGKVLGLTRLQLSNKELTGILKTKDGATDFLNIPMSSDGQFKAEKLYFFDTAKLYYQFNNDKDKILTGTASFAFNNSFVKSPVQPAALLSSVFAPFKQDTAILLKSSSLAKLQREQTQRNKIQTLSTVVVKTKQKSLKEKMDAEYTSGLFSGGDGYTFTTEDDPFAKSAQNVLTYLQGKVAGLQISTTGQGGATWRGSATSFFLNEMNTDVSQLQNTSMNDVAMIKVFRPPFFGASGGGAGGAIAVYTKKGASANSNVKGLDFTNLSGYSVIKQFYSPNYETSNDPAVADYRTTLYWNPFILMDKNNRRVTIPFYNSDNCKKIRVIIEGINEQGLLTREEKIFE
jgi:hypothetical protein